MSLDTFTATAIFVAAAKLATVALALIATWTIHARVKSRASLILLLSMTIALLYTFFDLFVEKAFARYVDSEHPQLLDLAYQTIGEALPALVWLAVAIAFFLFARSQRAA